MLSAMPSVSPTRWWSREEWHEYVLSTFELTKIETLHITIEDWFTARYDADDFNANGVHFSYLYKTIVSFAPDHEPQTSLLIQLTQAVVVDISLPLHQATYLLEGDGPLALFVIDILARCSMLLSNCWDTMDFPNTVSENNKSLNFECILPPTSMIQGRKS